MSLAPVINPVRSNSSHPWPSTTVENPHRVNNVLSLELWHSLPENYARLPSLPLSSTCVLQGAIWRCCLLLVKSAPAPVPCWSRCPRWFLALQGKLEQWQEEGRDLLLGSSLSLNWTPSSLLQNVTQQLAPPSWASNLPVKWSPTFGLFSAPFAIQVLPPKVCLSFNLSKTRL